ncbi:MAG: ABC transporter substrate-binding protein [Actinomycetota bacterium]
MTSLKHPLIHMNPSGSLRRRRRRVAGALLTVALLGAACGSDDGDDAGASQPADAIDTTDADAETDEPAPDTAPTTDAPAATEPVDTMPPAEEPPAEEPADEEPADDAMEEDDAAESAPLDELRIHHPETLAFAAPFSVLDPAGQLGGVATEVSIETWTTPDVLRSLLVNGETDVTAVPSYVGANLANRDVDIQLAAVVVWGLIWLLGPDGTPADWESLRGETVMIPFPNDMPDLVFQYLATANGLTPGEDFEIEYFAQPPEIIAQLVSGGGNFAVLPEHVATVAQMQANQNGQSIGRVFDLQQEWASAAGTSPRIPQAGIVVPPAIADDDAALGAVLDALEESVATVNAAAPETVATLSEASGVPVPLVEQVIPRLNLEVVAAADARVELEQFFTELATLSPDIIGGGLPDADFYLADPR